MPDIDFSDIAKPLAPPSPRSASGVDDLLERMRGAVSGQESGDGTDPRVKQRITNARTKALGEFQVLPGNIPRWTQKHLGRRLNAQEFANDPDAQVQVFNGEMGEYLTKARKLAGDDDEKAMRMGAAAWYGGPGAMHKYDDARRFRPNEPSFREYTTGVVNRTRKSLDFSDVAKPDIAFDVPEPPDLTDDTDARNRNRLEMIAKGNSIPVTQAAQNYGMSDESFKSAMGTETPEVDFSDVAQPLPPTPVPESPETLKAQVASAQNPQSPRGAVLVTPGEKTPRAPGLKPVDTPQGKVLVNPKKPVTDLDTALGTVDPVADTSQGLAVVAKDGKGTELESKIVGSPEAAQAQMAANLAMHGDKIASQDLMPAQDAVASRLGAPKGVFSPATVEGAVTAGEFKTKKDQRAKAEARRQAIIQRNAQIRAQRQRAQIDAIGAKLNEQGLAALQGTQGQPDLLNAPTPQSQVINRVYNDPKAQTPASALRAPLSPRVIQREGGLDQPTPIENIADKVMADPASRSTPTDIRRQRIRQDIASEGSMGRYGGKSASLIGPSRAPDLEGEITRRIQAEDRAEAETEKIRKSLSPQQQLEMNNIADNLMETESPTDPDVAGGPQRRAFGETGIEVSSEFLTALTGAIRIMKHLPGPPLSKEGDPGTKTWWAAQEQALKQEVYMQTHALELAEHTVPKSKAASGIKTLVVGPAARLPIMAGMAALAGPEAAFGVPALLTSLGQGEDPVKAIQKGLHGAVTGRGFTALEGMPPLQRAGTAALGTPAIDVAFGQQPNAESAGFNAAFSLMPSGGKGKSDGSRRPAERAPLTPRPEPLATRGDEIGNGPLKAPERSTAPIAEQKPVIGPVDRQQAPPATEPATRVGSPVAPQETAPPPTVAVAGEPKPQSVGDNGQRLLDLGYSEAEISSMKPRQQANIAGAGQRKGEAPPPVAGNEDLTPEVRQQLTDAGYREQEISQMTPARATQALEFVKELDEPRTEKRLGERRQTTKPVETEQRIGPRRGADGPRVEVDGKSGTIAATEGGLATVKLDEGGTVVVGERGLKPLEESPEAARKTQVAPADRVKQSWEMTQADVIQEARQTRAARNDDYPILVVEKGTGNPVTEIKQSQVKNLNTDKYEARSLGGGEYKPNDAVVDDGWIGNVERRHREFVESALKEGKPVPPEVLADYPDLQASKGPAASAPRFTAEQTAAPEPPRPAEPLATSEPTGIRRHGETMRRAGMDAPDVAYDEQTVPGWKKDANATIDKLGVDNAIKHYKEMPDGDEGGKYSLGDALLDRLTPGTEQYTDLARHQIIHAGEAGQTLRAAAEVARRDPANAVKYAEMASQRVRQGKGLTPDEARRIQGRADRQIVAEADAARLDTALDTIEKKGRPRKTKPTTLLSRIRSLGGFVDDPNLSGELARLGKKESGKSGLVNPKADPRTNTVERMAQSLYDEGYLRDVPDIVDANDKVDVRKFLDAVEAEASGQKVNRHIDEIDNAEIDLAAWEKHELNKQQEAEYEKRLGFLEDPEVQMTLELLAKDPKSAEAIEDLHTIGAEHGLSKEAVDRSIREITEPSNTDFLAENAPGRRSGPVAGEAPTKAAGEATGFDIPWAERPENKGKTIEPPSSKARGRTAPRKVTYEVKLKARASEALEKLKGRTLDFGGAVAVKPGEKGAVGEDFGQTPLKGDLETVAEYVAGRLSKMESTEALTKDLVDTFGKEIEPHIRDIRDRAYRLRAEERAAEVEMRPERRQSILGEIRKEIQEADQAERDAKRYDTLARQAQAQAGKRSQTIEAQQEAQEARKAERVERDAIAEEARKSAEAFKKESAGKTQAWIKAHRKEFQLQRAAEAKQAKAERAAQRAEDKKQRNIEQAKANIAKFQEKAASRLTAKEAKDRAAAARKELTEAREAEMKAHRERLATERTERKAAGRWDVALRQIATEARERLTGKVDPKDAATMEDLVSVGTEKFLKDSRLPTIAAISPGRFYREMGAEFPNLSLRQIGKIYRRSLENARDATKAAAEVAQLRGATKESQKRWEKFWDGSGIDGGDISAQAILIQRAAKTKELLKIRTEQQQELNRLSRSKAGVIWDDWIHGPTKSLRSTVDSMLLRQGLQNTLLHPIITAKTALPGTRGYVMSKGSFERAMRGIENHPRKDMAEAMGVELPAVEEQFQHNIASGLPHVRLSEQAATLQMTGQRLGMVDYFAKLGEAAGYTPENNPEFYKQAGRIINLGTGRGDLDPATLRGRIASASNRALFSGKLAASRFQLINDVINPVTWAKSDPVLRKYKAVQLLKLGVLMTGTYAAANAMGLKVGINPFDKDFGKLRVGNTRYDLTGGEGAAVRLLGMLVVLGYKKSRGEKVPYGEDTPWTILGQQLRYKLGPVPGLAYDSTYGGQKNPVGEEIQYIPDPKDIQGTLQRNALWNLVSPMVTGDFVDGWADSGLQGMLKNIPALGGLGIQTYKDKGSIDALKNEKAKAQIQKLDFDYATVYGDKLGDEELDTRREAIINDLLDQNVLPDEKYNARQLLTTIRAAAKAKLQAEFPKKMVALELTKRKKEIESGTRRAPLSP